MLSRLQKKLNQETNVAIWITRLISYVMKWLGRKSGHTGYFITQFLTGYGCFKSEGGPAVKGTHRSAV